MKRYFKLELDKCNFWQSEVKDGSKVYLKRDFKRRDEIPLNEVFFRQDVDGMFTEVTTGKRMKVVVINNRLFIDEPHGVDIVEGAFSSITPREISSFLSEIRSKKLGHEYINILNDFFVTSPLCEKASSIKRERQEENTFLRRLISKFHKEK